MALLECPECGKKVSTEAAACPGCGGPPPRSRKGETITAEEAKKMTSNEKIAFVKAGGKVVLNKTQQIVSGILAVFLIFGVAKCSTGASDPVVKKGVEALELAYVTNVKSDDASFTKCEYRLVGDRHIARCGISFGSTELAQLGYWEIEKNGENAIMYAMNGKALRALEKIGESGEFKSGAGLRASLDISSIDLEFNK
jgi:hypothetical protein